MDSQQLGEPRAPGVKELTMADSVYVPCQTNDNCLSGEKVIRRLKWSSSPALSAKGHVVDGSCRLESRDEGAAGHSGSNFYTTKPSFMLPRARQPMIAYSERPQATERLQRNLDLKVTDGCIATAV